MVSKKMIFIGLLTLLILTGCNSMTTVFRGTPNITGYVMDKNDEAILVVSTEPEDFSQSGGNERFFDAVWASNAPDNVAIGEEVSIWFEGGVNQSYPAQAAIGELNTLSSPTPGGADLSEAEALNKALTQEEFVDDILTLQSISYDNDEDEWTVVLEETNSYEEHTLQVEDN